MVNKFISVPKDQSKRMPASICVTASLLVILIFTYYNIGSLNCAAFVAGVIEAFLNGTQFVSSHNIHTWGIVRLL